MNLKQGLPVHGSFYIGNQGERKWAFIPQIMIHGVLGSGNHKGNRMKPLLSWGLHTMAGQQARGWIPADGMPARWWQAIRRKGKEAGRTWFQRGEEWLLISPEVVRKGHMGKTGGRGWVPRGLSDDHQGRVGSKCKGSVTCDLKFEAPVAGRGDLGLRGWVGARAYQGGLWLWLQRRV